MAIGDLGPGADSAAINAKYKGLSSGKNNERGKREIDQENLERTLAAQKSSLNVFNFSIITSISNLIQTINSIQSTINSMQSTINSLPKK